MVNRLPSVTYSSSLDAVDVVTIGLLDDLYLGTCVIMVVDSCSSGSRLNVLLVVVCGRNRGILLSSKRLFGLR